MKESGIVKKIKDLLNGHPMIWCFKHHATAGSEVGIPDIIGCYIGRFFAIEVKQPGKKRTKIQEHVAGKIEKSGGICFVATSVEDVKAQFLEHFLIEL